MSGWNLSVRYIKGVGQKRAEILQKVGIENFFDLLYYFPRRYEDRNQIGKISQAVPGENITVRAEILTAGQKNGYRGKRIFTVAVNDGTGILFATFFNQPYLQDTFRPGKEVTLFGRLEIYKGEKQMIHPAFEIIGGPESGPGETGRIVALYRVPEGLSQRSFHQIIWTALEKAGDYPKEAVPFSIRENLNLGNLNYALVGKTLGLPEWLLLQQAGAAQLQDHEDYLPSEAQLESIRRSDQGYGDESDDQEMITNGFNAYDLLD